jgi:hypothetical protein
MGAWDHCAWAFGLWALLGLGLLSAAMTRAKEGSVHQGLTQRLFLVCLGLVGLATIVFLLVNCDAWLSSGTTLSLMVLAAVCDFRPGRQRAAD